MKIKLTLSTFLALCGLLFANLPVNAQEASEDFSHTLVVQTDSEEIISDFPVTCYEVPNTLEPVAKENMTELEYTTNNKGEVIIEAEENRNTHYYCEAAQPVTNDGCWFFPNQSARFKLTESDKSQSYLVALESAQTCNSSEFDLENPESVASLLPSGTPAPIENTNINPIKKVETAPKMSKAITSEPASLWEWILFTFSKLFN